MGRESVLRLLAERRNEYLSGEALSGQLGISRAAVWKAVSALRGEGYQIEAKKGLGYRLTGEPDLLSETAVRARLDGTPRRVGQDLRCFARIDSTNTYLKRAAAEGAPDGAVAVAGEQTAGRGRRGRSFESPGGMGVYLSVLLRPALPAAALLPLTGFGAVAVCRALRRACGAEPRIKWTNDLILGGKKLGGILTELSVEGESGALQYAVMGIGINVSQRREDFSPEVAEIATSLLLETGRTVPRASVAAAMIGELDALYDALLRGETAGYLADYRRDCLTIGREVRLTWREGDETAFAFGVDDELGLMIRRPDGGEEIIRTGEVSVRGLSGYAE